MDDPNITMEEYIGLKEEKAHRQARTMAIWQMTRIDTIQGILYGNILVLDTEISEAITINEYLTKVRDDSGPGIVKLAFEENIRVEFWGQCIDELKQNMFFGKENEDPHEHIANIVDDIK
ncbi:hypothetical protein Tco_0675895 [Tanacetum coccineum]